MVSWDIWDFLTPFLIIWTFIYFFIWWINYYSVKKMIDKKIKTLTTNINTSTSTSTNTNTNKVTDAHLQKPPISVSVITPASPGSPGSPGSPESAASPASPASAASAASVPSPASPAGATSPASLTIAPDDTKMTKLSIGSTSTTDHDNPIKSKIISIHILRDKYQCSWFRLVISVFTFVFIPYTIIDRVYFGIFEDKPDLQREFLFRLFMVMAGNLVVQFILAFIFKMRDEIAECFRSFFTSVALTASFFWLCAFHERLFLWIYDYWLPLTWGNNAIDLLTIILFWHRYSLKFRNFVLFHHTIVGFMVLILNHVNNEGRSIEHVDPIEYDYFWPIFAILLYYIGNAADPLVDILKHYSPCNCIVYPKKEARHTDVSIYTMNEFMLPTLHLTQRMARVAVYIIAFVTIRWDIMWHSPANYGVLLVFGILLDLFDHTVQSRSNLKHFMNKASKQGTSSSKSEAEPSKDEFDQIEIDALTIKHLQVEIVRSVSPSPEPPELSEVDHEKSEHSKNEWAE